MDEAVREKKAECEIVQKRWMTCKWNSNEAERNARRWRKRKASRQYGKLRQIRDGETVTSMGNVKRIRIHQSENWLRASGQSTAA